MNLSLSQRTKVFILLSATTICAISLAFLHPIPQSLAYHHFADQRTLWGIPNFANTVSNIPFLIAGTWGMAVILGGRVKFLESSERWPYLIFFAGVAMTCIGSSYYHLTPDNDTLVWDRLPMTVAFMALLAAIIAERISLKAGLMLLMPLLLLGVASVWYWHLTEQWGRGDLRLYGFVQFFPALGIPLMMWLFPARYTRSLDLLPAFGFYALAKVLEAEDKQIYALAKVISGHTLKHLAATMATWWILRMLIRREAKA